MKKKPRVTPCSDMEFDLGYATELIMDVIDIYDQKNVFDIKKLYSAIERLDRYRIFNQPDYVPPFLVYGPIK